MKRPMIHHDFVAALLALAMIGLAAFVGTFLATAAAIKLFI